MPEMTPTEIKDAFVARGWVKRAGGDLYYDGHGGAAHPHLHLQTSSIHAGPRPQIGGDLRLAVCMLAFSDGRGGTTFVSNYGETVAPDWQVRAAQCPMSAPVHAEFSWIMSYFTEG
jgi:hypothetical protein